MNWRTLATVVVAGVALTACDKIPFLAKKKALLHNSFLVKTSLSKNRPDIILNFLHACSFFKLHVRN